MAMDTINENNSNLNQLYSTLTTWNFNFESHHAGLVPQKVQDLCEIVEEQKIANNQPAATELDTQNLATATDYLMRNKGFFTIAQFLSCFDLASPAFHSFSVAIFTDPELDSSIDRAELVALRAQVSKLNHEKGILQAKQDIALAAKVAAGLRDLKPENTSSPKCQPPQNPPFQFANLNSDIPVTFTSSANQEAPKQPVTASAPLTLDSLSSALIELTKTVNRNLSGVPAAVPVHEPKRCSITKDPPIFSRKAHVNMRKFGRKQFSLWARAQGLSPRNSIQFFCMCFVNDIERSHVDKIALDEYGNPKFNSVIPFIEKIIEELQFDEETNEQLRLKFGLFRAKAGTRLDAEFMRCCDMREEGWPCESEFDRVRHAKYQFSRRLSLGDDLHDLLYSHCNTYSWSNAASFFEISSQLRELQTLFRNSQNANGTSSNPKPTNSSAPQPMDISMSNNIGICADNQNNYDNQVQYCQEAQNVAPPQQPAPSQPSFNNMAKTCRNEECKKVYTPTNPKFYCCSSECVATWKLKRYGPEKGRKPKKSFNNMSTPAAASNNAKSSDPAAVSKYYITPTHVYIPGSAKPYVVKNALFDTGASLSFITLDLVEKLSLADTVVRDPGGIPSILGGDQKEMEGRVGYIDIDIAVEDTEDYLTSNFKQRMLVYTGLNHDLVLGQDCIGVGIRSFFAIPAINLMIFNPTSRQIKKANAKLAEFERTKSKNLKSINNAIEATETSKVVNPKIVNPIIDPKIVNPEIDPRESVPQVSVSSHIGPNFSESENFILNVPLSKVNETAMKMFSEKVEEITTGFVNNMENFGESTIEKILTTGGLDGTFDTKRVKVSDTKVIETNKGQVKVGSQLSEKMMSKFKKFVNNFSGKAFDHTSLGRTKQCCHPELKPGESAIPTTPKYMPLNPFMQSEAKVLVQQMVDLGVLEQTNEPANSAIFMVQKSSGKWRLIFDLKSLNKKLVDYVVHLPSPFELINKILTFKMMSYLDFRDAYFQVPLSEESMKNCPVVASVSGLQYNFKYLKMAQGLKIATAWFISILNEVYARVSAWVVNYLDDSVIGSEDDEEKHFSRVAEFVNITEDAGLRISLPKSVFFAKELVFLNYSLTNGAWSLSDDQRATINTLNADNLTKQKRESLAAFINHFNRFHTGVSFAARKIRDVNTSIDTVRGILDKIKKKLVESPALHSVNFEDPLHIYTDASKYDCAGVIIQKGKNGPQLITCFSKKFPEAIVNKPVHERELWSMQQISITYKYLLLGNHKKVYFNDNRIVLAAEKSKAPSLRCLFDTLKSTYSNVEFKFVPTNKNASDIFTRINNMSSVRNSKVTLTESLKQKILKIHVNSGCFSPQRILLTFQGMGVELKLKDVEEVLEKCTLCNSVENFHRPRRSAPGITIPNEASCQDCVFIDHKTILTKSRISDIRQNISENENFSPEPDNQSCLTVFEPVSSVVWSYPVPDYSSESVKKALRIYFMINGPSKNVVSDNAQSFTSLKDWLKSTFECNLHHTSGYHPNSNLSERSHREFEKVLKKYNETTKEFNFMNWEDALAKACVAMNALKHAQWKVSPYEIFKNRIQNDVYPLSFYPVGMERKLVNEKFLEKVEKIVRSKLKIVLPVFKKGDEIKVDIPNELTRFGIVTSRTDHCFKSTVKVKFGSQRPISIHKDNICVPRNAAATSAPDSPILESTEETIDQPVEEVEIAPVESTNTETVPVISSTGIASRTRSRR